MSERVAVIGAGTMGHGIAQTAATAGYAVTMIDVVPAALERGRAAIQKSLGKLAEKGKLPGGQSAAGIRERIATAGTVDAAADADLVIEAATENLALKKKIFAEADRAARRATLLASNTSSISITELAAATTRPALVVGMHFMNPVPVMQLVEVIRGLQSSPAAIEATVAHATRMGKTPVVVNDSPGFVSNRILMPMINEAVYCLEEGVGDAAAIDTIMKLGMAHPMGPLALADLIGLDVCLFILEVLHRDLGAPKYRPRPLPRRQVAAGHLGRKSGRGFHEYPA